MSNPFSNARRDVENNSWLARAALSSLRSAEAKFHGRATPSPLLRVDLRTAAALGAYETSLVSMALQDATAKLGHLIRDPSRNWTQASPESRREALLLARGQIGNSLFFGFPVATSAVESLLPEQHVPTVSEVAVKELCELLPDSAEDDAALDAVLGQRATARSAVGDLVEAVKKAHVDLSLNLTLLDHIVHSELSRDQAEVLSDALNETRTDRRTEQLVGRLDGVRTRRRIFYLELETEQEIHGAVGGDAALMAAIRENLDQQVVATVESEQVESNRGRRGRPTYRLISLVRPASLFDED